MVNIISVIILTIFKLREYLTVWGFGGVTYGLVEVVTRGYTHWSMILTGGLAFLLIYIINGKLGYKSLFLRCLIGCAIITGLEFIVGCIVNRQLNMNVWDYSERPMNILGQICPFFSLMWFLICIPANYLSSLLRRNLE